MNNAKKAAEKIRKQLKGQFGIVDARAESRGSYEYIVLVYESKEQMKAAHGAATRLADGVDITCVPALKGPAPLKPEKGKDKKIVDIPTYPYSLDGIESTFKVDRKALDEIPPIVYLTMDELRTLNAAYGKAFDLSLKYDIVIGVATGGIPMMDYITTKWCKHKFGHKQPKTLAELKALQDRHHVIPGLRAAPQAAAAELRRLLKEAKDKKVLIVDTTYGDKGIKTILDEVIPMARTIGSANVTVAAVIDKSRRTKKMPPRKEKKSDNVELVNILVERVVTEDMPEGLGREKLEPVKLGGLWANGVVIIKKTKNTGYIIPTRTLSAMLASLIEQPNRLRRRNVVPLKHIDDVVRVLIRRAGRTVLNGKYGRDFQKLLDEKTNAFDLAEKMRKEITGGLIWFIRRRA